MVLGLSMAKGSVVFPPLGGSQLWRGVDAEALILGSAPCPKHCRGTKSVDKTVSRYLSFRNLSIIYLLI